METTGQYDVVIIGGGAAGLSAALVLGRARRRVLVIDAGAPRNAPAAHMQGYLSRDGMAPGDLLAVGRAEVAGYGVHVVEGVVGHLEQIASHDGGDRSETAYRVHLAAGPPVDARRLLVTTGVGDGIPDLPGVRERWGRDLLHCPYCHGWEVRDEPLGVIGTGAGAVEHAVLLRQWSGDIVYFAHTHQLADSDRRRLEALDIDIVLGEIARLVVTDDRLTGVRLVDGDVVARTAVFVRPDIRPHPDGLLAGLACTHDDAGFVVTDRTGRTSNRGVWAAGNVADPRAQVITAAGAGSAAAIAINNDLVQVDVARAVADAAVSGQGLHSSASSA